MHHNVIPRTAVILPRRRVGVVLTLIDLRRGDAVHDHLHQVPERHLVPNKAPLLIRSKIDPVLKVVLVAPLVVKPGGGIADGLLLRSVGAPVSLVILNARLKFFPGIFRQVVKQPLLYESHTETIFHHHDLVFRDCPKMVLCIFQVHIHHSHFPKINLTHFSRKV